MVEDKILRLSAVIDATGCPKSLIYRRIKDGTFPRSVRIGPRSVGWPASQIQLWIQNPEGYVQT
ncbi:hypothetical protein CG471_09960 [Sphingobium sp. IP1]|jgi:prophage regulatory protein|uniref:helix-turn-helix transcriptional regulator n=1 Tax=Sphingobium TaxID=165695 RepID=UPI000C07E1DC|nr:AlpA family phage regulatory protein [Sphingobium sp. IP1]PHP19823.1 hypothetical protein CG471_09960 [Sphingobium sp. IP1]